MFDTLFSFRFRFLNLSIGRYRSDTDIEKQREMMATNCKFPLGEKTGIMRLEFLEVLYKVCGIKARRFSTTPRDIYFAYVACSRGACWLR